jgi:hypothetical protein
MNDDPVKEKCITEEETQKLTEVLGVTDGNFQQSLWRAGCSDLTEAGKHGQHL